MIVRCVFRAEDAPSESMTDDDTTGKNVRELRPRPAVPRATVVYPDGTTMRGGSTEVPGYAPLPPPPLTDAELLAVAEREKARCRARLARDLLIARGLTVAQAFKIADEFIAEAGEAVLGWF